MSLFTKNYQMVPSSCDIKEVMKGLDNKMKERTLLEVY